MFHGVYNLTLQAPKKPWVKKKAGVRGFWLHGLRGHREKGWRKRAPVQFTSMSIRRKLGLGQPNEQSEPLETVFRFAIGLGYETQLMREWG